MKQPISKPNQTDQSQKLQRPVAIGDLFEMVGRQRTIWTVRKLLSVRNLQAQAEMNQVDGCGRVTTSNSLQTRWSSSLPKFMLTLALMVQAVTRGVDPLSPRSLQKELVQECYSIWQVIPR